MSGKRKPTRTLTTTGRSASRKKTLAKRDDTISHPLPPQRSDAATIDYRTEFAALSSGQQQTPEMERSFIAGKLKLLLTSPAMHPADRERTAARFDSDLSVSAPIGDIGPVPGGVGYGMFYNSAFKTGFATGTALSWEIVCPTMPGGNVNTWLYLTATNRSGKGVEAFLAYEGQNQFSFNIFDWARPENERWTLRTLFAGLSNYIGTDSAHGAQCQVIAVMNTTYQDSPGNWVNEVRLFDVPNNQWHLVYRYDYAATLAEQTTGWVGSWGPIVETFQGFYSNTNVMGALKTQLLSRDSSGNWGQWIQLSGSQSDFRTDNKGFLNVFVDANYGWTVHS